MGPKTGWRALYRSTTYRLPITCLSSVTLGQVYDLLDGHMAGLTCMMSRQWLSAH